MVLGMGNALVDILLRLNNDDTLKKFKLPKGSMQLVDAEFSKLINESLKELPRDIASGGSAANTIHGIAALGLSTGFIGKVGNDELGEFFRKDMLENNINPHLYNSNIDTGKATALVSPDSQRTFATYLGAAVTLEESDVRDEDFLGYNVFHVEGYLVQNHSLLEKSLQLAKENGLTVSLDLASYNIVEENIDFLKHLLSEYVDIVFANEEEAEALTGKLPKEALHELNELCEVAVVKVGKKGSLIKHQGKVYEIGIFKAEAIDTTGAGDLYASGFLYGWVNDKPIEYCGNAGALCASKVVEVMGPKLGKDKWFDIKKMLNKL